MNYDFANLLGAPYRGGNLLLHGPELLSPVGNRVSQINLAHSTSQTLPFENLKQTRTLCLSPDGSLLLAIDADGRALVVHRGRRVLLHHVSFKAPVRAAGFSPDGAYVAVGVGKLLQVWHTPSTAKSMAPMRLHRTYGGCHDDITALDWSPCGGFIAVASKDLTARVFSLNPIPGYVPPILAGHKDRLVGLYFTSDATQSAAALAGLPPAHLYTVSADGALLGWHHNRGPEAAAAAAAAAARAAASGEEGGEESEDAAASEEQEEEEAQPEAPPLARGLWEVASKHYFMQRGAKLSCCAFHRPTGVLVAGFSHGVFEMLQLPEAASIHTLSVGRERLTAAAFSAAGDWVALGCAALGQLLVWEWRSETYVLKQQGHYFDVSAAAYSPDGALLATGADDAKVKVFQLSSGFCYVTFTDHTAPVTAVRFLPSGHAVLSASLDGTVRAFDLVRYRNFRTLTTPQPAQFLSLAVDPGGEIACAGTLDGFQVCVWSVKTGRLLDVLAGHEGPVCGLAFSPSQPILASCSWDKTVRLWDVYDGAGCVDTLQHSHDVLAIAYRPDGKQLAAATLDGSVYFWDAQEGELQGTIEGRRDVRGGAITGDKRSAANAAAGAAFTSLTFSADGSLLFAGGNSKYVCVYDVAERLLLRKFQVTHNRSLDGVLDQASSRGLTDAGPLQLIDHDDADDEDMLLPPNGGAGATSDARGAGGGLAVGAAAAAKRRPAARVRALALSPTGQSWAAATTEGVLLYALDTGAAFDPTDLSESLTPAAFAAALAGRAYVRALLIALRLGDEGLLKHGLLSVPLPQARVPTVARALPAVYLEPLLRALAACLAESPHLEFLLHWLQAVTIAHGAALQRRGGPGPAAGGGGAAVGLPVLRALQQALARVHADLAGAAESNAYTLDYLVAASKAHAEAEAAAGGGGTARRDEEEGEEEEFGGSGEAAAAARGEGRRAAGGGGGEARGGEARAAKGGGQRRAGAGGKRKQAARGSGDGDD
ncbi:MAG: WD40 repeat-like protein [Monoraphidium minutum]|nr:MAG: WD40 repeat-like protein [Monoraphidium minutum]